MIFRALCYKNCILWKRNRCLSICETVLPITLTLLLVLMRVLITKEDSGEEQYLKKSMDFNFTYQYYYPNFYQLDPFYQTLGPCLKDQRFYGGFIGPEKDDILKFMVDEFQKFFPFAFSNKTWTTRQEYEDYINSDDYWSESGNSEPPLCFAVEYENTGGNDSFTIFMNDQQDRFSTQQIPTTKKDNFGLLKLTPDKNSYELYKLGGFMFLERLLGQYILNKNPASTVSLGMAFAPMKTESFQDDGNFEIAMGQGLANFILIIFLIPLIRFIYSMTQEKETKIKEAMLMMGMSEAGYNCSWFVYYLIISFSISFVLALFGGLVFFAKSMPVILFLVYFSFALAVYGLINFFQSIFSSPRNAIIVGIILYWLSGFVGIAVADPGIDIGFKFLTSIFPTVGMQLVSKTIASFEASGTGVQFDNWNVVYQNYTIIGFIGMMLLDGAFFWILGWYLENVLPHDWGVRKGVCFCVSRSYWCGNKKRARTYRGRSMLIDQEKGQDFMDQDGTDKQYFEEVPAGLKAQLASGECLSIRNLQKTYPNGKRAVNGISLDMYKGQIFALLGHNGAGKTTTISILTGLLPASGGAAYFGDINMFQEMSDLRKVMGICPQHDILFPDLTPEEHLNFYAMIKGITNKAKRQEQVNQIINKVGLDAKRKAKSSSLSGGQKRKLSVGIALIGDSQLVMLDEPTSGMDLTARRELWNMLKDEKQGRVIVLTTHFMDEADILGDRIAIMANGQLECLGSSLFLKNKFGVGYRLTMSKLDNEPNLELDGFVSQYIPSAKKLSDISNQVIYQLPLEEAKNFSQFFTNLDNRLHQLRVREYGMAVTTLEEVFLTVGHGDLSKTARDRASTLKEMVAQQKRRRTTMKNKPEQDEYTIAQSQERGWCNIFFQQCKAQMFKRIITHFRNLSGAIIEIFIPLLFIIAGLALTLITYNFNSPGYPLSPETQLQVPQTLYLNNQGDFTGYFDSSLFTEKVLDYPISTDLETDLINFDNSLFNIRANDTNEIYGAYRLDLDKATGTYNVVVFANLKNKHSVAIYGAQVIQALVRYETGDKTRSVTFDNQPFPIIAKVRAQQGSVNGISLGFMLVIAFAIVPGTIVRQLLMERRNSVYHQQLVSGGSKVSYWAGTCVTDFIRMFIVAMLGLILIFIFSVDIKFAWLLVLVYPFPVQMFSYVLVMIPWSDGAGMIVSYIIHIVAGALLALVVQILRIIDSTKDIGKGLMWGFRWIPPFALADGIGNSSGYQILYKKIATSDSDYFVLDNLGGDLIFYPISFIAFFIILVVIESWSVIKCPRPRILNWALNQQKFNNEFPDGVDSDVAKERERMYLASQSDMDSDVTPISQQTNIKKEKSNSIQRIESVLESLIDIEENVDDKELEIKVVDLQKTYNNTIRAVRYINFGLSFGECFALLGVNGAGKSSTFKVLTGEIEPSSGVVQIHGSDAIAAFDYVRKYIGYCPQIDTIFPDMTVVQHLKFHAVLKNIVKSKRQELIQRQMEEMDLIQYKNVRARQLSGGNKRKLCVAVAMIGNPPIVLLDEPSTGIDPKAKRFMWNVISRISKMRKKSAVVLTTHSMEEAEALSTKIGIMVAGQFKCYGSAQHLKNKFSNGYELDIKVKEPNEAQVAQFFAQHPELLPESIVTLENVNKLLQSFRFNIHIGGDQGAGKDMEMQLRSKKNVVTVQSLYLWGYVEHHGMLLLEDLRQKFGESELVEHYFAAFKFRLKWKKGEKFPIGAVFQFLEQGKNIYSIAEYSVAQTTLEQIFNTFAQEV